MGTFPHPDFQTFQVTKNNFRKLPDCNILASLCRKVSCSFEVEFSKDSWNQVFGLFGSHNFLLFSSRLKQKQAVFYPNQSKKEQSGSKSERNDLILSNQILDAAKVNIYWIKRKINSEQNQGLIVRKNALTDEEETRQRLAKMEKSLLLLAEQQNHILSVLNGIAKWYCYTLPISWWQYRAKWYCYTIRPIRDCQMLPHIIFPAHTQSWAFTKQLQLILTLLLQLWNIYIYMYYPYIFIHTMQSFGICENLVKLSN